MRSYLLAAAPRVGGTWLCAELTDAGLGAPGEHLNWLVEDAHGRPRPIDGARLMAIHGLWRTHRRGGVYGVKVHLTAPVARLGLDDLLPPGRRTFIRLTRADRDAQARSLAIAREHGCWFTSRPPGAAVDGDDVARARADLDVIDARWDEWFAARRIDPLTVTYEDVVDDLGAVIDRIAAAVGGPA